MSTFLDFYLFAFEQDTITPMPFACVRLSFDIYSNPNIWVHLNHLRVDNIFMWINSQSYFRLSNLFWSSPNQATQTTKYQQESPKSIDPFTSWKKTNKPWAWHLKEPMRLQIMVFQHNQSLIQEKIPVAGQSFYTYWLMAGNFRNREKNPSKTDSRAASIPIYSTLARLLSRCPSIRISSSGSTFSTCDFVALLRFFNKAAEKPDAQT